MPDQPPYDPRREGAPVVRRRSGPPQWTDQGQPRAWSEVPPPRNPPPRNPPPSTPNQYAPRQTPQPYRDQPYRDQGYRQPPPPARPAQPSRTTPPPAAKPRKRRHWGRRIGLTLLVIVLLIGGGVIWADTSLGRVDALANYEGRVGDTPGTNWLLVGSDSRAGLSAEDEQTLATGGDVGAGRTDTILLIHIPESGATTMVSLPRDSYVSIPGYGQDKLNAAFAFGGAPLLAQTVEGATGLHVDHYAEVGFGGFSGMVDALGGVDVCVPYDIVDPLAGIDLRAGCQKLDGPQALGFVRSRATQLADIDRMNNQRLFLSALLAKATGPSTFLNPFRLIPLVSDTVKSLQVDDSDHIWNLASLALAMRGDVVTTTVPVGGFEDTDVGNVLRWDNERASVFFDTLARDQPLPPDLLTGG